MRARTDLIVRVLLIFILAASAATAAVIVTCLFPISAH